jgi:hypothetical protein
MAKNYETKRSIVLIDTIAPMIVLMETLPKDLTRRMIFCRTESEYLRDKWCGDFSHRYLNSDDKYRTMWLDDFFEITTQPGDTNIVKLVMMFFYNNSLDSFYFPYKHYNIDGFGCSKNWCQSWLIMDFMEHDHLITKILS